MKYKLVNQEGQIFWVALDLIGQTEEEYLRALQLTPPEQAELSPIKGRRRLEWLAVRQLLHKLLQELGHADRAPVEKSQNGQPLLQGLPFHISFSHSRDYVAVILANQPAGIDVQHFSPRMERVSHKFMREEETACLEEDTRLAHLHYFWCAKEALFKAQGGGGIDFRRHLLVQPFPFADSGHTQALVAKEAPATAYHLYFENQDSYFMAFCVKKEQHVHT
jgi:phosphopantetheinyl transferase